jgi:ubiquitin carboxyl-terminal hydrolase 36/42
VPPNGLSPDQAISSPGSTANGKGKGVANGQTSSTQSGPSSVPLPMNWPQPYPVGPGYHNLGNTCFLNSTLQALTHTPPLVACLMGDMHHSPTKCKPSLHIRLWKKTLMYASFAGKIAANRRFCLLCAFQKHIQLCFRKGRPLGAMEPSHIVKNLSSERVQVFVIYRQI